MGIVVVVRVDRADGRHYDNEPFFLARLSDDQATQACEEGKVGNPELPGRVVGVQDGEAVFQRRTITRLSHTSVRL